MLWSFKTYTGTTYSCLWDKTNSGQGNACQNPRSLHGHWWAKDSSFSSCITCPGTKIAVCIIIKEQAQCQKTTNLMMWQWLNSTHTQLSLRKTNSLFFKCMKIRSRYKNQSAVYRCKHWHDWWNFNHESVQVQSEKECIIHKNEKKLLIWPQL